MRSKKAQASCLSCLDGKGRNLILSFLLLGFEGDHDICLGLMHGRLGQTKASTTCIQMGGGIK